MIGSHLASTHTGLVNAATGSVNPHVYMVMFSLKDTFYLESLSPMALTIVYPPTYVHDPWKQDFEKHIMLWTEHFKVSHFKVILYVNSHMLEPCQGWGGRIVRTIGDWGHQLNKDFEINYSKLIWTHRDWSSKHRTYGALPRVLCLYTIPFSLVFSYNPNYENE